MNRRWVEANFLLGLPNCSVPKVNVPGGDLPTGKCDLALVCGQIIGATREDKTTFLKVATGIGFHRDENCGLLEPLTGHFDRRAALKDTAKLLGYLPYDIQNQVPNASAQT